jgi:hypothetical protein
MLAGGLLLAGQQRGAQTIGYVGLGAGLVMLAPSIIA